jgi:predicted lipid carrier protein YhbT
MTPTRKMPTTGARHMRGALRLELLREKIDERTIYDDELDLLAVATDQIGKLSSRLNVETAKTIRLEAEVCRLLALLRGKGDPSDV